MKSNGSEIILYNTDDGQLNIEIKLDHEAKTIWLSQAQMAKLFDTTPQSITQHIRSIYLEGELDQEATCKDFLQVRLEGSRQVERNVLHYNLKVILAVGYRVKSERGTQFRIWATEHLNEYLVKGFVMNDQRLKEPDGWDYFDEMLERIRDIRASEKRFYQKIKDLFSQTSVDYDKKSEVAQEFFATIQNKLIFAEVGKTAAELIASRASGDKPNMGLTAFSGKKVRKKDITTSKNYLSKEEITNLNRIVTMFLDFAEDCANRRKEITMKEWIIQTDEFLNFHKRDILKGPGKKSHVDMEKYVNQEFKKFEINRRKEESISSETEHIKELETTIKEIKTKQKTDEKK